MYILPVFGPIPQKQGGLIEAYTCILTPPSINYKLL
jgi:hypothetical protein